MDDETVVGPSRKPAWRRVVSGARTPLASAPPEGEAGQARRAGYRPGVVTSYTSWSRPARRARKALQTARFRPISYDHDGLSMRRRATGRDTPP